MIDQYLKSNKTKTTKKKDSIKQLKSLILKMKIKKKLKKTLNTLMQTRENKILISFKIIK